ncbi:MAG: metallophosphoesterase family protein [Isosphaeraceae bacterium]
MSEPTMRLAWLTDLHLNFVEPDCVDGLCRRIRDEGADAVLISGDIAEAPGIEPYLEYLDRQIDRPIFFVLGNHDFYRGGIEQVRSRVAALCARSPRLRWLNGAGVVGLTAESGLIGHDGWADGRLGDYAGSDVFLNDYLLIEELAHINPAARLERLHALGDAAAEHFRRVLPEALARFRNVIAVTHVPPFREACWHRGRISGDDWLPHFACKAVGDAMVDVMSAHPDRELLVLCGHTHSAGEARILPNLRVRTGGAEYGRPEIAGWIDLDGVGARPVSFLA